MGDILWDETRCRATDVTASVWHLWQKWGAEKDRANNRCLGC